MVTIARMSPKLIIFAEILAAAKKLADRTGEHLPEPLTTNCDPMPVAALVYENEGEAYIIPFGDDSHAFERVVVMAGPLRCRVLETHGVLDALQEAAKTDAYARSAYKLLEEYQYDQLLAHGIKPNYATGPYQATHQETTIETATAESIKSLKLLYVAFSVLNKL